jgi:hypothetical protein
VRRSTLGERRRVESGESYGLNGGAEIEFTVENSDSCALHRGKLPVLGRRLNDAIGARRAVMVGVALGRVSVQRLGCGGRSRGGCGLRLNRGGIVAVGVRMGMSMAVAMAGFPVVTMGMSRVVVGGVVGSGGLCLGVG